MGDRTWTGIQFSGDMSMEQAEELLGLLDDQCNDCSDGPRLSEGHGDNKFELAHLAYPHNQFTDDECNYATMEGIESWCTENHISYRKTWSAGGDYGPGIEIYHAVVNETVQCADVDGDPVIGISDLVKAHEGGKIEETIAFMRTFLHGEWEKNFAPVKIAGYVAEAA